MIESERMCEQVNATLMVHGSQIEQIDVKIGTRTLGVYVTPTLKLTTPFEKLRTKVIEAMGKLMSVSLTFQETVMCYNFHVLSSIHYGCGITTLNEKEERELRRTCETPILIKLGFSNKFPRDMMCVSKEMLGLGLFLPSTMIAIQALRMCLGNKRISSNASRMIAILE